MNENKFPLHRICNTGETGIALQTKSSKILAKMEKASRNHYFGRTWCSLIGRNLNVCRRTFHPSDDNFPSTNNDVRTDRWCSNKNTVFK
jgi:hypothetical protein